MPLVMMSGLPASGKTRWANWMQARLQERAARENHPLPVHVINDECLGIRKSAYGEARTEKVARGTLMSAVSRVLTSDAVVIVDALNYIKGFRYQLYCEAKAVPTPSCVVRVGASVEQCREWNKSRHEPYDDKTFDELCLRYEEPNEMSRWDSPLFVAMEGVAEPDIDSVWAALVLNKSVVPNQSTLVKPSTGSNMLAELDRATQDVIASVATYVRDSGGVGGGEMRIGDMMLRLPMHTVSMAELQRLRRQFLGMHRMKPPPTDRSQLRPAFVEFLHSQWEIE